ncbi:arsenical pump-driving ATPase [Salipaludibacillus agaradhaerens]|jgi:arsenite-transporting ATPase|uniref:arsenical pump-driving ATPase n=1 Tax=Salipaludibacillus agaradhaerens TaxID=76935 RepID=UPI0021508437|nr:arsenical pump-driving ATPase [Salipaludibacillus agaradhaerens]MCR6105837.1 arsenical pump-driving ATPase [Salipaludibacillus agaradhaerens]MCR6117872.1 arsenical pump-driving ATPase [Salipaludibacillus agaradhaerens]UJW57021.1 arsenical pump-driving ATPase [Bacillus sp. A116_S68]
MDRFKPEAISNVRHLFFTGKGGVGKTSMACATAVALADQGRKVLIVSTDPASNLQDVFGVKLENKPTEVKEVLNLYAANLDPEQAAKDYREKMVGPYRGKLPEAAIKSMEEQLSGACTVEIAAFDEFTKLLTDRDMMAQFDHIIFDTAPTGHTLRLLQLPSAWTDFLATNESGASCLGPLAGLEDKKSLYAKAVEALANNKETLLILVSRPDKSALLEAARAGRELSQIGINNQQMIINGLFERQSHDELAMVFEKKQKGALEEMPSFLHSVPTYYLPLVPFNVTGIEALRDVFKAVNKQELIEVDAHIEELCPLTDLVTDLEVNGQGVMMTMGKGGVGKTTIAAAIALELARRGHKVHLTTTDPADHLSHVLHDKSELIGELNVSRIDPEVEVARYKHHVLEEAGTDLTEEELAYMKEDLESPCTEEIAVFRAFANVVAEAEDSFVIIDTAPTGHTLLLLDAAESFHREVERSSGDLPEPVKALLPKLRDPNNTFVTLVTLPEATPVYEASRLQDDLQRAGITPFAWIINQSLQVSKTTDPILKGRAVSEHRWISKVDKELSSRTALVPWQKEHVVGEQQLKNLLMLSEV